MLGVIGSFLGGMFSSSKLQNTAIDGIRKMGGLDEMDAEAKAKFLLDYMAATKHQSPMRRFIALTMTIIYGLFVLSWIAAMGIGYAFDADAAVQFAVANREYFSDVLATPFSLVLSFYFLTNIAQKAGK